MAEWLIRIIGKQRKEIDKGLLAQAVLALGRQLWEEEQAAKRQPAEQSPADTPEAAA